MKKLSWSEKTITLLLALVLVFAYSVPVSAVQYAVDQGARWYDSIPEMLAAGDYEEGVVIAGIDMSKAKSSEDPGSALKTKKLRTAAEELIAVDNDSLGEEQDTTPAYDVASCQEGDGICVTSIQKEGMTTEQILRMLASDDSVVFAEPNYTISMSYTDDKKTRGEVTPLDTVSGTAKDAAELQWSSSDDASLHASNKPENISMNVPGWNEGSNMDHEIIVAVVDLPVDFSHPDLVNKAYTFSPELQEKLRCDVHGFNATWESPDGKIELYDGGDHGSHVAGIIGASWNGEGISGVGSNVKLVSVQISNSHYTSLINVLRGYGFIKDAIENGVDIRIINNSWGLTQSSKALDAAVTELGEHGVLSCFAAGNESVELNTVHDITSMLANNPYAISVAATTPSGELAGYSNFGKGIVTLGAPGSGILSCMQTDSASYLPSLAEQNKVYENFEDAIPGTTGPASVSICQVGFKTEVDEKGNEREIPDPDNRISGTNGVVVSGNEEMGFEGDNALKVSIDKSNLGNDDDLLALRMDFSDLPDISAGDSVGFAYGSKSALYPYSVSDVKTREGANNSRGLSTNADCWGNYDYVFETDIDTSTDGLSLIFQTYDWDAEDIYFDSIGIGNDRQPYAFMSGTSMASPAVAGAAAVIASRHYNELEGLDASGSAKTLANLVRSSVRPLPSLRDVTSTGGIIDLSVDANSTDPKEQPGPDITDVTVSGRNVRLTGVGFGETKNTVEIRKYIAGAHTAVESSLISWNDRAAALTLNKDFEGIMEVVLTSANGKKDTIVKYISRSSNLFERDHHIGSDTGEPFEFDEPERPEELEDLGDFETYGVLVAGDGKLYYMPQIAKVELNPAYRSMYCYDPEKDSWTACPPYPLWIRDASGAWLNGKLYVKGTSVEVDSSGTIPHYDMDSEDPGTVYIYSFTPGDNEWESCNADNVFSEHTLFATDSKLMLAGVAEDEAYEASESGYPSVREYDPSHGAGEVLGHSPSSQAYPKVAYAGGHIYLCEYDYRNKIYVLDDSMSAGNEDTIEFPSFFISEADWADNLDYLLGDSDFALVSDGERLILVGAAAKDGSSDTFVLKAGEKEFTPCSRRISDAEVKMPSAAMLNGRLYVIGTSVFEPKKRIFRSTVPNTGTPDTPVTPVTPAVERGKTYKQGGQEYTVTALATSNAQGKVTFRKAKNAKKVTVPATVKLADGKKYKVTAIGTKAFKGKKIRTATIGANVSKIKKYAFKSSKAVKLIVKTKKLTKKSVKGSLKGSKVKTVKVKVGKKRTNKKYVKKYRKIFTKKNCGKKVRVR